MAIATAGNDYPVTDRHPMAWVSYVSIVMTIGFAGLWLSFLANSQTALAVAFGIATASSILLGAVPYVAIARRTHRSPLVPTTTSSERQHYIDAYRH